MNIEELKLILETINSVSNDASTAVIWWMALHYGSQVFFALCWLCGVILVFSIVTRQVAKTSEWEELGKQVSVAYGGDGESVVFTSDKIAIKKAIEGAKK